MRQHLGAFLLGVTPMAKRVAKEAVRRFGKPRRKVTVGQIDLAAIAFPADFGQNEMAVRMISDMVTRRYPCVQHSREFRMLDERPRIASASDIFCMIEATL